MSDTAPSHHGLECSELFIQARLKGSSSRRKKMSKRALLNGPLVLGKPVAVRGGLSCSLSPGRWVPWSRRLLVHPQEQRMLGKKVLAPAGPPSPAKFHAETPTAGLLPGPPPCPSPNPQGSQGPGAMLTQVGPCFRRLDGGRTASRKGLFVASSNQQEQTKDSLQTKAWDHRDSRSLGLVPSCILNRPGVSLCGVSA